MRKIGRHTNYIFQYTSHLVISKFSSEMKIKIHVKSLDYILQFSKYNTEHNHIRIKCTNNMVAAAKLIIFIQLEKFELKLTETALKASFITNWKHSATRKKIYYYISQ